LNHRTLLIWDGADPRMSADPMRTLRARWLAEAPHLRPGATVRQGAAPDARSPSVAATERVAPDALAVAAYRMHTDRGLGDTVYSLFVGKTRLLVRGFERSVKKGRGPCLRKR
jgi:hypothetical protein